MQILSDTFQYFRVEFIKKNMYNHCRFTYPKDYLMFTKEKIKDLHYSVTGKIAANDLQKIADEILTEFGKTAKMAGFRTGHIPLNVLRQKYNASAYGEAIDKALNKDLDADVAEKKIRLAGQPRVDLDGYEIGKDVEYSLEFDILPTLPKIDLDKITVTKKVAKLDEKEVTTALENIRKSRSVAEKQDEKYKAKSGDVAVIDFKGFVGKKAFAGGEASKHHLILGSGSFIPGFEDQIIGHKAGEKFDIIVKFPDDYHAKDLAGQDARFEIFIHEVRKHILPELNDELAKQVGQDSIEKLKEHIREIITNQYDIAAQQEMRNELLDVLADKVKLDLPENLVVQELDMAKREHEHHNAEHGHDHKWDEKKERKEAERRVKLGLILAEWGSQNKVEVTRDDMQNAIWDEASRYPDPKQIFEFYNTNPNAVAMLRGMVFERKALDAMLTHVKQKEKSVPADELFKQASVR